jgi:hypothetical protein
VASRTGLLATLLLRAARWQDMFRHAESLREQVAEALDKKGLPTTHAELIARAIPGVIKELMPFACKARTFLRRIARLAAGGYG